MHYLKDKVKKLMIWSSGLLLDYIGLNKIHHPKVWVGWRPMLLRMLWVDYRAAFLLAEPHHFSDLGVKDNILRVIYADGTEGPVSVNNPFNSSDIHIYFWQKRCNYELENVIFDSESGLVLINGMVVIESSHRFPKPDLLSRNLAWRCKNPRRLDTTACSGIQWAYNYAHWLTEDLISVLRIRKQFGHEIAFITPRKLARFQVEALDLIGVKRIEIDVPVVCNKFFLAAQHQRSEAAPRPSDIALLRQTFLPVTVDGPHSKLVDLDIYVSRSKTGGVRSLSDEKALEQMLAARGFLVVHAQDLSFNEEVALFSSARTVVGITGSGLINHLWMPQGGQLIEIRVNDLYDPSSGYTCPLLGLYLSVVDCRKQSFETPADLVMQKISECLEFKYAAVAC